MSKLTTKQLAYIAARAEGLKGREAAIAAGYSPAGADVQASTLNRNETIRKAIAAAKRKAVPRSKSNRDGDEDKPRMKASYPSSLELLRGVYNNDRMPDSVRIDAAKAALPFEHARLSDAGKKEKAKDRAREIARGGGKEQNKPKFATKAPPALRLVGSGKV